MAGWSAGSNGGNRVRRTKNLLEQRRGDRAVLPLCRGTACKRASWRRKPPLDCGREAAAFLAFAIFPYKTHSQPHKLPVESGSFAAALQRRSAPAQTMIRLKRKNQVRKNERSDNTKRRGRDIAPRIFLNPAAATRHFLNLWGCVGLLLLLEAITHDGFLPPLVFSVVLAWRTRSNPRSSSSKSHPCTIHSHGLSYARQPVRSGQKVAEW
jgi:hypothetical protein